LRTDISAQDQDSGWDVRPCKPFARYPALALMVDANAAYHWQDGLDGAP
jgi:hypothetical protein